MTLLGHDWAHTKGFRKGNWWLALRAFQKRLSSWVPETETLLHGCRTSCSKVTYPSNGALLHMLYTPGTHEDGECKGRHDAWLVNHWRHKPGQRGPNTKFRSPLVISCTIHSWKDSLMCIFHDRPQAVSASCLTSMVWHLESYVGWFSSLISFPPHAKATRRVFDIASLSSNPIEKYAKQIPALDQLVPVDTHAPKALILNTVSDPFSAQNNWSGVFVSKNSVQQRNATVNAPTEDPSLPNSSPTSSPQDSPL